MLHRDVMGPETSEGQVRGSGDDSRRCAHQGLPPGSHLALSGSLSGPGEWTTWFNIDHPGGQGDYERLDAIQFYYGDRVCARPLRLEARTTSWTPAGSTGQVVHGSPLEGFWCLNREQRPGQNCSNYTVRFLCPPGEPGQSPLPTSHQPPHRGRPGPASGCGNSISHTYTCFNSTITH